jgi:uncharacterized protein (TIGR04141 family)
MPRKPRKEKLNIFLMKEGSDAASALRADVRGLKILPISPRFSFSGEIKFRRSNSNPPRWHTFVQSGAEKRIEDLLNQGCGAVIVLTAAERVFCVAFGSGYHWVDEQKIERRFGMMVTLNAAHPQKIKSVDREEFDIINRVTRSQTSVSSGIENFGMDVQRDLVRSVAGQPEDEAFAAYVSGADSLTLSAPIKFGELAAKCAEALTVFRQTRYRERYAWIDNFVRVRDRALIQELEQQLLEAVKSGTPGNTYLSPPNLMDTQEHSGFRYPGERNSSEMHEDLRLDDFLRAQVPADLTVQKLKARKIKEYRSDSTEPSTFPSLMQSSTSFAEELSFTCSRAANGSR